MKEDQMAGKLPALLNCANFSHFLPLEGHALINQEHELWLKAGDDLMKVTEEMPAVTSSIPGVVPATA